MAEDLGTWPPEQARVLLDALQKAGLSPKARRARDGIAVSVSDDEADEAHRTLVANMDAIARAAKSNHPRRQQRGRSSASQERRLASQRLGSFSRPMFIVLLGLILAIVIRPLALPIIVFTIAALVYVLGRQNQGGDGHPRGP